MAEKVLYIIASMAARQKEWARNARARLLAALGNLCAECGVTENLEFDCILPQGDAHHKFDTSARMSFYRKQHAAHNIQILCAKCHIKKSHQEITS